MQRTYADLTGMTFWDVASLHNPHIVAVGPYRLAPHDIQGCSMTTVTERDTAGRVWTLALFVTGAIVITLGVLELGWQTRFLIGSGVLCVIAMMSAVEALKLKPITHWRLDIALKGGRRLSYATASRTDAEALTAQLNSLGRRNARG
jgi:hypothetical protein